MIIKSEIELLNALKEDIRSSEKQMIKIFAGHLPVLYRDGEPGQREVWLSTDRWGEFSLYSFNLGCELARYALDSNKDAGLLIVGDDLIEVPKDEDGSRKTPGWMRRAAKRAFREENFPAEYRAIAERYALIENIVEQPRSFGSSKVISEMSLLFQAMQAGRKSPNECSLAYNAMLDDPDLFNQETDYLIAFIPGQCKGNICTGVLDVRKNLAASHIFFPHIEKMGGILDAGAGFSKVGEPVSIESLYASGEISYTKTAGQ